MSNGYIKLHRKLLDNPITKRPAWAWLWVVLLMKANHEDKRMIWNNEDIIIKKGSFITGRKQLSQESHIPKSTVEDILTYLEKSSQIRQQKNNKFRLITIEKWVEYQVNPTSTRHLADTNKNDKNDKNIILATNVAKPIINYDLIENIKSVNTYKGKAQWQDEGVNASKYFIDGKEKLSSILKCYRDNLHKSRIAFSDCKELEKRSALYFFKVYNNLNK